MGTGAVVAVLVGTSLIAPSAWANEGACSPAAARSEAQAFGVILGIIPGIILLFLLC